MSLLRHRGSGLGRGSRRGLHPSLGDLGHLAVTEEERPEEVAFRVMFRSQELFYRLCVAILYSTAFAYMGAFKITSCIVVYFFCILLSALFYYRGSTFTSSLILCGSLTLAPLFVIMLTGGLNSAFLVMLTVCPPEMLYTIGPKSAVATAAALLPCVIAMAYVPSEWNELEACLRELTPEARQRVHILIRVMPLGSCVFVQCGILMALMVNLKESYEQRLKVRVESKAVEEANRFRRDFVASISHELRTPMNAICGACENLLNECANTDDTGWISLIDNSARTLLALVNDIISIVATQQYGSPNRKQIQLQSIPCDFIALLNDAMRTAKLNSPKANVELRPLEIEQSAHKVCESPYLTLLGDPDRFRQIVSHLVSNALKFTEKGSVRVTLSSRPTSPEGGVSRVLLLVAVTDTGIGIAADKLTEIFEPFAQVDGTVTRRYGGTGVGLTISRNLAEIMKGSITVTSDLGRGSRFLFSCPVCVEQTAPPPGIGSCSSISSSSNMRESPASSSHCRRSSSGSSGSMRESPASSHHCRLSISSESRSPLNTSSHLVTSASSSGTCSPLKGGSRHATASPHTTTATVCSAVSASSPSTSVASVQSRPFESGDVICSEDQKSSMLEVSLKSDNFASLQPSSDSISPASNSDSAPASASSSHSPKRKRDIIEKYPGCMCIVVDDNLVNVRVLSNHLRRLGLTIETAVNGEEAVELARTHGSRASCIFMDIMMPVMDGIQATREIRRLGEEGLDFLRDIPIYACTTLDTLEDFLQAGMNGCLLKPVSFPEIQNVFREITVKPLPNTQL